MTTYASLLQAATARLAAAGVATPRLDAEVLLAATVGIGRTVLYTRLREPVSPHAVDRLTKRLARRAAGEPVAYLVGRREFWSLEFCVTPDVLIPRPETELLIEIACRSAAGLSSPRLCDVGTGSGCIAVALARELPRARLVATDLSRAALAVAQRNAAAHTVNDRIAFVQADVLSAFSDAPTFDVIASNPPYVADTESLPPDVDREPVRALRAGRDGLDVVRRLIAQAPSRLRRGGWLLSEIGQSHGPAARRLAIAGGFEAVSLHSDLAGIPRVLAARRG